MATLLNHAFVLADAKNRGVRTLIQNLAFDVIASVVLVLYPIVTDAKGWSDFDWQVLGFLVTKTVVVTIFSYFMRTVLDKSKLPTPLPPEYPGEPADPVDPNAQPPAEGGYYAPIWLLVLVGILVVLAILYLLGVHVNVG